MTETWQDIQAVASPILVMLFGMIVLLADTGSSKGRKRLLAPISIIGLTVAAFAAFTMLAIPTVPPIVDITGHFGGGIVTDRIGGLFCIVLCIAAALAVLMSGRSLAARGLNDGEYYALILFATSGAMLMALSLDLVNIFLGLEVLSVALYILCGFTRREIRSEESAVKYFLLGSFATGFLLYGIALIYGSVGMAAQANGIGGDSYTNLTTIANTLLTTARTPDALANSPVFVAGMALLFVGLAFKAAIVPFHWYAPDVYEGAPTGVTAFMSVGAKVGAFAAFIRIVQMLTHDAGGDAFRDLLWWLAVLTMVVGNAMAVIQKNIKRMLAYSSIAHAGYILVGVLASTNPAGGSLPLSSVVYYLFTYTFMNIGAFAVIMWLGRDGIEFTEIADYAGLAKRQPFAAAVMTILLLSLAGFPPVAGFFGKLYLFLGAVQSGYPVLAAIGLVVSGIGVYYYLSLIATLYFRKPIHDWEHVRGGGAQAVAVFAAIATLLVGIFLRASVFASAPTEKPVAATMPTINRHARGVAVSQ